MATQTNSRNLLLSTATTRIITNQKSVSVTAPTTTFLYTTLGVLSGTPVIAITATKQNTTEPVTWTTNPQVTLYSSSVGSSTVTTDSSTANTSVVYLRGEDFAALNINSLRVTATATDVDVLTDSLTISKLQLGSKGDTGASGDKFNSVIAWRWMASTPSLPVADLPSSYKWSNGAVTQYPSGWTSSAPASLGGGYTLYQISVAISAAAATQDTAFNWNTATLNQLGFTPEGVIGLTGDSARVAYLVTTSATVTGVTAGTGDVVPTSGQGTWSPTATTTLQPGQYMYQVDGKYSFVTNTTTWGNPYLSNLKVGSLSALAVDTGNLTVSSQGSIKTADKSYAAAGGFFIGNDNGTQKFSIGDKLLYNGTTFSLPGITLGTDGKLSDGVGSLGQVTIRGLDYTGDLNAASGVKLKVTGTGLILNGNSCDRATASANWDSQCYSVDAYTGGAYCSFVSKSTTSYFMAGLNSDPAATDPATDANYENIDYAFYMPNAAGLRVYETGVDKGAVGTYVAGDVLSITYDGQFVRYAKNGVVLRSTPAEPGLKLYFDSSVRQEGFFNIQFGPYANTNTTRGLNLVDSSWWNTNVAPTSYWLSNTDAGGVDQFVAGTLPDGTPGTVWQSTSGTSSGTSAGGGWANGFSATNRFTIDPNKTYLFAVYTKSISGTGTIYFGLDAASVCNLNTTTAQTNPLFANIDKATNLNEWYLLLGYVYPTGTTGNSSSSAGAYRCIDGVEDTVIPGGTVEHNYNWLGTAQSASTRAFSFFQTPGSVQQFAWPQVYLCDGSEPSLDDLLSMSTKGNLSNKLSKSAADSLKGPINLTAANAITVGNPALDTNPATQADKNGFYIGNTGIVATKSGKATVIISNGGDATFSGSLTAASITGATGTFSGSLNVKSAATGQRTEITDSVIRVYDNANVLRVKIGDLS